MTNLTPKQVNEIAKFMNNFSDLGNLIVDGRLEVSIWDNASWTRKSVLGTVVFDEGVCSFKPAD